MRIFYVLPSILYFLLLVCNLGVHLFDYIVGYISDGILE